MNDALMDSLEPFDFSEAVDFKTAYQSGYIADRYDVDSDTSVERAQKRFATTIDSMVSSTTTGFNSVSVETRTASERNNRREYALLPVWLLHVKWKNTLYTFAMNGQTGKFVGNLPFDKGRYWKYWLLYALAFGGGLAGLVILLHYLGMGGGCL